MTRLQIQYFLAVAQTQNFTRAAQSLYVAQPSVTKQIKALESELGTALFQRGRHAVTLTQAGAIFRDCFARFEADLSHSQKAVAALLAQEDNTLRFAAMNAIAVPNYNRFVQDFCARHSEGRYDLIRSDVNFVYRALRERRVDLAMVYDDWLPDMEQGFDSFCVMESEYLAVMKPSHPLAGCGKLTAKALAGYPLILTEGELRYLKNVHSAAFLSALEVDLGQARPAQNYLSCFSAVEVTDGIVLLDEFSQIPSRERYVRVPTGIRHRCCAVWSRGEHKPLFQVFLDELRQAEL